MNETNPAPALEATLERVLSGIERIEARLDALEAQLPPLAATAADTLDAWSQGLAAQGILLPERLKQLETLAITATAPAQLEALTQLLSHLQALTPYLGLLDQLPGLLATAADSADELASRGQYPLSERLPALQSLAGSLTEPAKLASLQQLLVLLDQMQPYLALLPQLPGLAAMTADSVDQTYQRMLRTRPELHQLRKSLGELSSPQTLLTLAALGEALAHSTAPTEVSLGQLAKSLWDPAVRRTLGFGLRFAQHLGRLLPSHQQEDKKHG